MAFRRVLQSALQRWKRGKIQTGQCRKKNEDSIKMFFRSFFKKATTVNTMSPKVIKKNKCVFVCESACVPSMAKGFPTVSSLQSASIETSKSNRALSMMNASRAGGSVLHHRHTNTTRVREACFTDNWPQTFEDLFIRFTRTSFSHSENLYRNPIFRAVIPLCHLYRRWD